MKDESFFIYLLAMAGITYLIRAVPLIFIKKRIENVYLLSFLKYMPYAILSVMTVPMCFYATGSFVTAAAGFVVAVILSLMNKNWFEVSIGASIGALISEFIVNFI